MFGLSTEFITRGKLATVKRFVSACTFKEAKPLIWYLGRGKRDDKCGRERQLIFSENCFIRGSVLSWN